MYSTIILAYDGSRAGRLALREGARLAQICHSRVVVLAVVDPSDDSIPITGITGVQIQLEQSSHVQEVQEILDEGVERLERMGLTPVARLERGDPAETILVVADEVAADLVVVGHHKRGLFSRWLTESVTSSLTNRLKCSLLVARLEISDDVLFGAQLGEATRRQ